MSSKHSTLPASGSRTIAPFVEGRYCDSRADETFEVRSPSTGRPLFSYGAGAEADVERAVTSARRAFEDGRWSAAAPSVRKGVLHRLADLIEREARELDRVDAEEMGKPVATAFCNAAAGAAYVRFCAEAFDKITGYVLVSDEASLCTQRRMPHGVVAGVASWNFPFYIALLKCIPALAAGNTVVLKPSELSPGSALRLAELALEAGLPAGVLNVVPGVGSVVGRALGLHNDVDMLSFTGSTQVGKLFLEYSGRSNMKKLLTECGGKSPQVVLDDDGLDLDDVAEAICRSILCNQGQVCSAGTRVIVQDGIAAALEARIKSRFEAVETGDPLEPTTTFGPLASVAQLLRVEDHIAKAQEEGAELVSGGRRVRQDTGGYFLEPALFCGVRPDSALAREEVFGPVLAMMTFKDEDEAVRLANATDFGLYALLWSSRIGPAMRVAKRIRSSVLVRSRIVQSEGAGYGLWSEPARQSGMGVEGGLKGIESYLRHQSIAFVHG